MKPADLALALLVTAIWGLGFTLAKAGLDRFPPILLMGLRFALVGGLLVWLVPRPPRQRLGRIALLSLVGGTVHYALAFTGLQGLDASTAVLVIQLEAPFLAILGALFLGERIGWRGAAGLALALVGVALIVGEPRLQGAWGPLALVVGGAFAWAVGQLLVATLKGVGGFTLIAWVGLFSAPQLLVLSLLVEEGQWAAIRDADLAGWGVIAYLVFAMTGLGYGLWYRLLGRLPVNSLAPFVLLVPLFTVISGMALLGERLTAMIALGGALVLAGVALVTLKRG